MRYHLTTVILIMTIGLLSYCTDIDSSTSQEKGSSNQVKVKGENVYKQYCILCHGADGKKGFNQAKDLSVSTLKLNERIQLITNGKGNMTPFKGVLSKEEIRAVAKYSMTLGK